MTAAATQAPSVRYAAAAGIARIELQRPDRLNAWTPTLGRELLAALERARGERAVLISGAGRAFSAGADLTLADELRPDGDPDVHTALRRIYNPVIRAVRDLPLPVIAAVHGAAVGIGCSLALACDFVVAAESARFDLGFARVGLIPDGGASASLLARVGLARATELVMLAEPIGTADALRFGLINRVHRDDDLAAQADALAARLAAGPTLAYAGTKRVFNAHAYPRLAAQLELEDDVQQQLKLSDDFAEGVLAFRERRPPRFEGR